MKPLVAAVTVLTALAIGVPVQAQTWHGLRVAPESRCSPYRESASSYPQSIEARIVESLGGVWSPYTGRTFAGRGETDIEHMVARSEAHDSGLRAISADFLPPGVDPEYLYTVLGGRLDRNGDWVARIADDGLVFYDQTNPR